MFTADAAGEVVFRPTLPAAACDAVLVAVESVAQAVNLFWIFGEIDNLSFQVGVHSEDSVQLASDDGRERDK